MEHYYNDWEWIFNEIIARSKLGDDHVWCVVCSCNKTVLQLYMAVPIYIYIYIYIYMFT